MLVCDLPADLAGVEQDPSQQEASFLISLPCHSIECLDLSFGSVVKKNIYMSLTPKMWVKMLREMKVPVRPSFTL